MVRFAAALVLLASCLSKPDRVAGGPDADLGTCDMAGCMAAGGSCMDGWCTIDGRRDMGVQCPAGMPCRVTCMRDECDYVLCRDATACDVTCVGDDACSGGVGCERADTCSIRCDGMRACRGLSGFPAIGCGDATCEVMCNGMDACERGISVQSSDSCTAACCDGACENGTGSCMRDDVCN